MGHENVYGCDQCGENSLTCQTRDAASFGLALAVGQPVRTYYGVPYFFCSVECLKKYEVANG